MKSVSLLCFVASLVPCLAFAGVKEELEARYRAWDKAYKARDLAAIERILHPDFRILTGSGKKITRASYLTSLKRGRPPKAYETKLLRVHVGSGSVIAMTSETSAKPGERPHAHRYRDTWVKRDGKWLLLESKTLEEH